MIKGFQDCLIKVLEQNYHNEEVKASSLPSLVKMSRSTLHHKLKNRLNISAAICLRLFRVAKAIDKLKETKDSIKIIAYQVGFRDPNYFSRVFKHEVGMSPSAYRLWLERFKQ